MSTIDQYKEEAMRLLDHFPLEVCQRLAERLQGRGWILSQFNINVQVYESLQWYARVHIKTEVTKTETIQEKWQQLVDVLDILDMRASKYRGQEGLDWEEKAHRAYGSDWIEGHRIRICKGKWYEFHLEFKPARQLELSVLTDENV